MIHNLKDLITKILYNYRITTMDTGSKIVLGSGLSLYMLYAAYKIQKMPNDFYHKNEFYHFFFGMSVAGCVIGMGIGEYIRSKK
jgi:hypothetical protein